MATSRIFIRGLPPSLSDPDFKRHFSAVGPVTDTRLFSQRRIGYVGYETPEQAAKAVKYFNKTFIRMSRLAVEFATPVAQIPGTGRPPNNLASAANEMPIPRLLKRKRSHDDETPLKSRPTESLTPPNAKIEPRSSASRQNDTVGIAEESQPQLVDSAISTDAKPSSARTEPGVPQQAANDLDWMRSRTSRVLGLTGDDDDDDFEVENRRDQASTSRSEEPSAQDLPLDGEANSDKNPATAVEEVQPENQDPDLEGTTQKQIRESGRLFLRNLSYQTSETSLREVFSSYSSISEVHVPLDSKSHTPKGFAFVLFDDPDEAVRAWEEFDGKTLNGRLLHILPGAAKREAPLDDFALSKLPLKKQQSIKRRREAGTSSFKWNSLYMNADAVISSVASRLGLDKSQVLDPTSSDAAVRQAHAETHVIQETKSYFNSQGVNLDAFASAQRGDVAVLVKNFPFDTKTEELQALFEQHGKIKRFLVPPTGTLAVVEYYNAPDARSAYTSLAYRKFRGSMLFLEKAPQDLFDGQVKPADPEMANKSNNPPKADDLLQTESIPEEGPTATLFVRNLNFSTTTNRLDETFRPLDGFLSARVKTKSDPKKPGEVLSMGFGFLEFRSSPQAQKALKAMDGYNLDGHTLEIRASHKGQDAAEATRRIDAAKQNAAKKAKLVIKNLPFEAGKKDVQALFRPYGQLRSVRLPRKIGQSSRGFAFAEFTTPKEAESARNALRNTHLLGRRLVIDYAAEDPEDAEEELERMQNKVGSQMNKVAVQKLMGDGRKKFTVNDDQDREES